ncbi:DUF397 domain-containing protein [Streptomyces sp. SID4928]|uniref:DUF397 domain-containing protein n=1 Tax=unclassified Streptomyces TaxID=2593676 RepID=UPI0001C1A57E|nr:DUF397 domain-containing protein [Streptomyces sp. ACT-1]EGE43179.1 protein of unknown function DUF397 [Streptomyces sp. ACT-1]MYR51217.1 DUF397 domain-containing protein [Streptomyces sp. SID4928]
MRDDELEWQLSSYTDSGACVEVARPAGEVLVRDSKRRTGPHISITPGSFADLVDWAKTHQV